MADNLVKKMLCSAFQILRIGAVLSTMLLLLPTMSHAESAPGITAEKTSEATSLPDPLTPQAVREMLSKLSDSEVRNILLKRLDAVAQSNAEARKDNKSGLSVLVGAFTNAGLSFGEAFRFLPQTYAGLEQGYQTFLNNRGFTGLLKFLAIVASSIGLGFVANWIVDALTRPIRERIQALQPEGLWDSTKALLSRFGIDLVKVVAFALVSLTATSVLHSSEADAWYAGRFITTIFIFILLFLALGRVIFAPNRPDLRLMPIDNEAAHRFQRQMLWLAILGGLGPFLVGSLEQAGLSRGTVRIGFWTTTILHLAVIAMIYFSREGIRQAIKGDDDLMGPWGLKIARVWPWIAMVLVALNWVLIEALAAAGRFDLLQGQHFVTLLLIVFIPLMDTTIRGLVHHLTPPMLGDGEVAKAAYRAARRAYLRMGRILVLGLVLVLVANMFGIEIWNTESSNFVVRAIAQLLDGMLYFFLGYLIWEGVGVWLNHKLAKEHTEAGIDLNSDEPGGGEGGGTGLSRMATILPVVKLVSLSIIAVMTVLLGLSHMGVDTTPLLAGAGIVGFAIGFGAQTLVRDVVSGIFFLIEDAFRVGEYLVLDTTVGTVEKISIRSLQLRHHMGAVHTIPYGEIPKVTNNSRDWTITKLKFTLPFETDPNQIKKIFKKIGAEMLEADYAGDIIQTFKSQGVYDVDDVGMVFRGKFMTKPGTQWIIRKDVYNRVNKALDEAGIQFARREVRVQLPGMEGKTITNEQAEAIGAAAANAVPEPKPV